MACVSLGGPTFPGVGPAWLQVTFLTELAACVWKFSSPRPNSLSVSDTGFGLKPMFTDETHPGQRSLTHLDVVRRFVALCALSIRPGTRVAGAQLRNVSRMMATEAASTR